MAVEPVELTWYLDELFGRLVGDELKQQLFGEPASDVELGEGRIDD